MTAELDGFVVLLKLFQRKLGYDESMIQRPNASQGVLQSDETKINLSPNQQHFDSATPETTSCLAGGHLAPTCI